MLQHVTIEVTEDQVDACVPFYALLGFEPDPRAEHWGSPRSFVRNPAGHRVEVMAGSPARR